MLTLEARNLKPYDVELIAMATHEVNRRYCMAIGDFSQHSWDDADGWQRDSARDGVLGVINGNGPRESHESWKRLKELEGWTLGAVKDPIARTHPCMVPYDELPPEQKAKDTLFVRVVAELASAIAMARAGRGA